MKKLCSANIIRVTMSRLGCVVRMEEMRNAYKVLLENLKGSDNNIKMNLKYIEYENL